MSQFDKLAAMGVPIRRKRNGQLDGRYSMRIRNPARENRRYRIINGEKAHRLMVETRIGRKLPDYAIIHHVDPQDKRTNEGHFVVCPDNSYHQLIEMRGKALRECGNPNWRKCYRCGKWDDPRNLIINTRPERGPGMKDVVHQERGGVCVDLDAPRPINAGRCEKGPRGRHNVETRKASRKRGQRVGLTAICHHCQQPIRRTDPKSGRWFLYETTRTLGERVDDSGAR